METNEMVKMLLSQHTDGRLSPDEQMKLFPTTRYMGSKNKLLNYIWDVSAQFSFDSVLDLFSGSGVVSYMYKTKGKSVVSNDYMTMGSVITSALIENNNVVLSQDEIESLMEETVTDNFVFNTFRGIYFSDADNHFIDMVRTNINKLDDEYKKSIAMGALIRTCTKKRPRGIFTYVGDRYNDGRMDLQKSFAIHFREAIELINSAVFDNGAINRSYNVDSMQLQEQADLIYIDPPYYTPKSDNEYVRRYHFVEGLARDWQGVEIQLNTKTKKFKSYPTPFSTKDGAAAAFDLIFKRYSDSILIVSYSSNSLPTMEDMLTLLKKYKKHVEVIPVDYRYSFGTRDTVKRNNVQEYIFVGA